MCRDWFFSRAGDPRLDKSEPGASVSRSTPPSPQTPNTPSGGPDVPYRGAVQPDSPRRRVVLVEADPSMRWKYLAVWTLLGLPLLPLMLLCGVAAEALTIAEFWPILAISFGVWVLWSLLFCIGWTFTSAVTSYQCDGSQLVAVRRGRIVRSINCDQIATLSFVDKMDLRSIIFDVAPPPEWPSVRIELKGPARSIVILPEIMIWGRAAIRSAERELTASVRSHG